MRGCPACLGDEPDHIGEHAGHPVARCRRCRSLWVPDVDASAPPGEHYGDYYHPGNLDIPEWVQRRCDEVVGMFDGHRRSNRLLDVGCGAGAMVAAAGRAGWDAEGVEISPRVVAHLVDAGLTAHHGLLEDVGFPDAHFDVVMAIEVLEHLPDPALVLAECRRILRPGGVFYATTPNGAGISARMLGVGWSLVDPPDHLQLFSPRGARDLLARAGFEATVRTEGVNPAELVARFRRGPQQSSTANALSVNERLVATGRGRTLKRAANAVLRTSRLGDSLKITAT